MSATAMPAAPSARVSAVVPVRNDDHGENLRRRATFALQAQASSFDEIVLVDFNTARGVPPLLDTLGLPGWALAKIRSLVIGPEGCDALLGRLQGGTPGPR